MMNLLFGTVYAAVLSNGECIMVERKLLYKVLLFQAWGLIKGSGALVVATGYWQCSSHGSFVALSQSILLLMDIFALVCGPAILYVDQRGRTQTTCKR